MIRRFILRLLVLFILVAATCWVIIWKSPIGGSDYLAAIVDKHYLLENAPSPKIVFVGGSSVAFSLDSRAIQESLHYQTVNMGLHAGLGLRYMLSEVEPYLRKGDMVVIVPEYGQFVHGFDGNNTLLELLIFYPQAVMYFDSPRQIGVLLSQIPVTLQRRFAGLLGDLTRPRAVDDPIYNRKAFNSNGDVISHLTNQATVVFDAKDDIFLTRNVVWNQEAFEGIRKFVHFAESKEVIVLFSFPAITDELYQARRPQIEEFYTLIQSRTGITTLGRPEDYVFKQSLFFDTVYHLNGVSRAVFTQRLLRHLRGIVQ